MVWKKKGGGQTVFSHERKSNLVIVRGVEVSHALPGSTGRAAGT